jgi:hypothetical protein
MPFCESVPQLDSRTGQTMPALGPKLPGKDAVECDRFGAHRVLKRWTAKKLNKNWIVFGNLDVE